MTKVVYNGKVIELVDEFEKGFVELDMLTFSKKYKDDLEDTIKLKSINFEDTKKLLIGDTNE